MEHHSAYALADAARKRHLLAGVFEHHDRERFETIAISLKPADASPIGKRLRAAFTQFIDVSQRSDRDVIALMRELEVDIAVDLMGCLLYTSPSPRD